MGCLLDTTCIDLTDKFHGVFVGLSFFYGHYVSLTLLPNLVIVAQGYNYIINVLLTAYLNVVVTPLLV